jgi:hypothetical protein
MRVPTPTLVEKLHLQEAQHPLFEIVAKGAQGACHLVPRHEGDQTDCGCSTDYVGADAGPVWDCFSGCSPGPTGAHDVNPALCAPQLQSTIACHPFGSVCAYTFEVPCVGDAGLPPDAFDGGSSQCVAWCAAVKPADYPLSGSGCFGTLKVVDGGSEGGTVLVGQCGVCNH